MKKSKQRVIFVAFLGLILSGCSASRSVLPQQTFGHDGILALSRPMPQAIDGVSTTSMLGFVPAPISPAGTWLSINRHQKTVSLMEGDKAAITVHGDGIEKLSPGSFHLMHKQRSPLWYAPDSYFSERGLAIPPEGDRERYRRGALGEFAMFLDKDTPLHAGVVWTDDVGGIRVEENDLARLYYSLDVGSTVKVE